MDINWLEGGLEGVGTWGEVEDNREEVITRWRI
jgi:hypothetical protein